MVWREILGENKFRSISNIDLVLSEENPPVEKVKMTMAHAIAGIQYFNFIGVGKGMLLSLWIKCMTIQSEKQGPGVGLSIEFILKFP
jgi:hypothetical protein